MVNQQVNGATPRGRVVRERPEAAHVRHSIEEIVRLSQRDRLAMSRADRVADVITAFSGSMLFVALHALWFGVWIAVNLGLTPLPRFDPFPFGLLTMVVSLEAIFLSTFVLLSQNRQALQADRRAKINMQVDILAEQESTKIMTMLAELQEHLGMNPSRDPELAALSRPTRISRLADAIDEAERAMDPEGAKGPDSAVDTEA